ncbi:MAG: PPC domain-containing protein [Verrucomicrobiota bacterium]|nr:PPC domain-containing protein [Verrucomicrobiota bacterium]
MLFRKLFATVFAVSILFQSAFSSSPSLGSIIPRGAKRGTEVELNFNGDRLDDAVEILFYSPGFTVTELTPGGSPKHLKAKIAIGPETELGEHLMRIRTKSGLSGVKSFWVGQFETVSEIEPNSEFATPQTVPFNSTIEGILENEDVDYYVIEAKKGQRISAEVEGIRLGNAFYDPYVAILNMERFELAASDDTSILLQDSTTSIVAPTDGKYIVQIRESSYTGNGACRYRLHIGSFPRPLAVYPAGGPTGSDLELKLIGDSAGESKLTVKLPQSPDPKFEIYSNSDGLLSPSPNIVRVSAFPNVLETEPNNNRNEATASSAPLPLALNGIIQAPGDEDWFKFTAKKGQRFIIRAHAKSIGSPLDPILNIYGPDKKHISGNDDADNKQDSKIDFTAAVDGEFNIRIRDHLKKGGENYVYRIETESIVPSLGLTIPYFGRADYQSRQMIYVARGNRFVTRINAGRSNFGGDLIFEASGLPEGIKLISNGMHSSINSGLIGFEASPEAPIAGTLTELIAKHADPEKNISGNFSQPLDFVLGAPNNTVYYKSTARKLAVAVVEEIPFKIDITPPTVPLVKNGTLDLKVNVTRKEGFDAPITVRMLWNPPGIGSQPTLQIPKGKNDIIYTINANGSAAIRTWDIAVMGESDAGKGQILASSNLTPVTVAEPYLGMKIEMAAVEQGQDGSVICKLTHTTPFEGKAKIKLLGLPAKVTAPEMEIDKGTTELSFPIKIATDSPKGQHKNLFCHLSIPQSETLIPHNVGHGGVLRIDPPPKKPAPKPAPVEKEAPKVVAKAPPKPKPLSRLEKLRLEAKKK